MKASIQGADPDLVLRLDALRESVGEAVPTGRILDVVQSVVTTLVGGISVGDLRLYHELESLADYIRSARSEIAALRRAEIKDRFIASATDELDAIIAATEDATNEVMDVAEKLETLASDAELDGDIVQHMSGLSTRLFEACSFQDLTGQRITKIVRMLKEIECRVESLIHAFGPVDLNDADSSPAPTEQDSGNHPEANLLNGPQLPNTATDQDEIDRLFASIS